MATYRAYLGGKEIQSIYLGGKEISRVYGGDTLLWEKNTEIKTILGAQPIFNGDLMNSNDAYPAEDLRDYPITFAVMYNTGQMLLSVSQPGSLIPRRSAPDSNGNYGLCYSASVEAPEWKTRLNSFRSHFPDTSTSDYDNEFGMASGMNNYAYTINATGNANYSPERWNVDGRILFIGGGTEAEESIYDIFVNMSGLRSDYFEPIEANFIYYNGTGLLSYRSIAGYDQIQNINYSPNTGNDSRISIYLDDVEMEQNITIIKNGQYFDKKLYVDVYSNGKNMGRCWTEDGIHYYSGNGLPGVGYVYNDVLFVDGTAYRKDLTSFSYNIAPSFSYKGRYYRMEEHVVLKSTDLIHWRPVCIVPQMDSICGYCNGVLYGMGDNNGTEQVFRVAADL